ncbi:MAG: cytochrome c biogenesis protein CcsA [Pseudomonadota bacterium]
MTAGLELQALWAALVLYVLAGSTAIFGVVLRRKPERMVLAFLIIGLVLHTITIGLRWERVGHGPYINMYEMLLSNIWSLILIYSIAYWRLPAIRATAALVMPIIFMLMGWLLMSNPYDGNEPNTYHTIWMFIHIGFAKVFLGTVLVAVGISGIILLRQGRFSGGRFARMPDDKKLDELSFRLMAIGLIFESLMLITGAIWAQDALGRYWNWDPLETWAFLTWIFVAFSLHLRLAYKTTPRTSSYMIIVVFVLAFLTFFGVPFVTPAPHQGIG